MVSEILALCVPVKLDFVLSAKTVVKKMYSIITTTAPGCDDTVQEGFNGYKVKAGDSMSLSKKLQILIENKELRIQMGKNSRELFLKNFTLEKVVSQTFELYNSIYQ